MKRIVIQNNATQNNTNSSTSTNIPNTIHHVSDRYYVDVCYGYFHICEFFPVTLHILINKAKLGFASLVRHLKIIFLVDISDYLPEPKYLDRKDVWIIGNSKTRKGTLVITIPDEYAQKHGVNVKDTFLAYEAGEGLLFLPWKQSDAEKFAKEKIKDSKI